MRRWLIVGGGVAALVVGFLVFRPDTLFTQVVADETLDEAFATTVTEATTARPAPTTSTLAPPSTTQPVATTAQVEEPLAVTTGQFTGIDHRAAGTATVYEQAGEFVLRFEDDTDIQNGPDLFVWLLPASGYEGGSPAEYIDLGTLKGTVGGQNYTLPGEFDPGRHRAVLIWCLRFQVPFAAASLS